MTPSSFWKQAFTCVPTLSEKKLGLTSSQSQGVAAKGQEDRALMDWGPQAARTASPVPGVDEQVSGNPGVSKYVGVWGRHRHSHW